MDETLYELCLRILRQLDMRGINTVLKPKLRFECLKWDIEQKINVNHINHQYKQAVQEFSLKNQNEEIFNMSMLLGLSLQKKLHQVEIKKDQKQLKKVIVKCYKRVITFILKRPQGIRVFNYSEAKVIDIISEKSTEIDRAKRIELLNAALRYLVTHKPKSNRIQRIKNSIERLKTEF